MTKLLLALPVALLAVLIACDNGSNGGEDVTPGATPGATAPTQDQTPTPGETPTEIATVGPEVCQPNPDPATPDFQVIDEPGAGDAVTDPVTISGLIVANEATFQVTIYDADGNILVDGFGMSEQMEAGELAPFSTNVPFTVDEPTPACIWVYEESARDGSPTRVGQIPVTLLP